MGEGWAGSIWSGAKESAGIEDGARSPPRVEEEGGGGGDDAGH